MSRARTRLKTTAVAATTHARVRYLKPSAAKALKKLGPAWMPTEKMKGEPEAAGLAER
jgi:hypothetical protein